MSWTALNYFYSSADRNQSIMAMTRFKLNILVFVLTDRMLFHFQTLVAASLDTRLQKDGKKEVNIHISMGCKVSCFWAMSVLQSFLID